MIVLEILRITIALGIQFFCGFCRLEAILVGFSALNALKHFTHSVMKNSHGVDFLLHTNCKTSVIICLNRDIFYGNSYCLKRWFLCKN